MRKDDLLTSSIDWSTARNDIPKNRKAEAMGTSPPGTADRLYNEMLRVTARVMRLFHHGTSEEKEWAREKITRDSEGFGFWLEQIAEYQQKDQFWGSDEPGTPESAKSDRGEP